MIMQLMRNRSGGTTQLRCVYIYELHAKSEGPGLCGRVNVWLISRQIYFYSIVESLGKLALLPWRMKYLFVLNWCSHGTLQDREPESLPTFFYTDSRLCLTAIQAPIIWRGCRLTKCVLYWIGECTGRNHKRVLVESYLLSFFCLTWHIELCLYWWWVHLR